MFGVYTKLRGTFVFKSWSNFTLSFLGFSTTGYFVTNYYHERQFEHPLINEAIRIIGHSPQVIELAGYPLNIDINFNSRGQSDKENCNFRFNVRGPKGRAQVELIGSSKKHSQIQDTQSKQKYYIPSFDLACQIYENRQNPIVLADIPVLVDQSFWKIDQLVVDIGMQGDYRITFADENDVLNSNKIITFDKVSERKTLKNIKDEMDQRNSFAPQNEQDIEQLRLYRQSEMYRRMGNTRIYMILFTIFGGMGTFIYLKKNKRLNIKNSQLHLQSLEIIKRNQKVRNLFGLQPRFNEQIRGQQIGNQATFETDIIGLKSIGKAYIQGKKNQKTNEWDIDSIEVSAKSNNSPEERFKIL